MKKRVIILLFIISVFSSQLFVEADASSDFLETWTKNMLNSFSDAINEFSNRSAQISSLYASGGELKGTASIGSFPSFRAGITFGTVFYRNPISFLHKLKFSTLDWDTMLSYLPSDLVSVINWFDSYFLPLPITNYHFHVGLPKGFTVGTKFTVAPFGSVAQSIVNGIDTSGTISSYVPNIMIWGVGVNVNYTILKEYRYFPTISVGFGVDYSDSSFAINNISLGNLYIDASNDSIPGTVGFSSHNYNTSISFSFSISKRIIFFQPFLSVRLVQTIAHNVTKMNVHLDLSSATQGVKDTIAEDIEISNVSEKGPFNNDIGSITPQTDFIVTAGFEFVMRIFNLGLQASYSLAAQTGSFSLGMRFQVEKWQFAKLKKKK